MTPVREIGNYKIRYPDAISRAEIEQVGDEVALENVYRMGTTVETGERWVDAGCHVGIFSTQLLDYGALPAALVDSDKESLDHAAWNVRYASLTDDLDDGAPIGKQPHAPAAFHRTLGAPLGLEPAEDESWHPALDLVVIGQMTGATALKLDIQGAEHVIFAGEGLELLRQGPTFDPGADMEDARNLMGLGWNGYRKLLFEYHPENTDHEHGLDLDAFEAAGWHLQWSQSHTDILLNAPTVIYFFTSDAPAESLTNQAPA